MIIHQIGPKDKWNWHVIWHRCHDSWIKHHGNMVHLWNDHDDLEYLIKSDYKKYYNMYMLFPFDIMRLDFARLAILHQFGGLYADLDVFCYDKVENLPAKKIYLVNEVTNEFTTAEYENCLFGANQKYEPFFLLTMDYVKLQFIQNRNKFESTKQNNWRSAHNDYLVNNITGSGMLSGAVKSFRPELYGLPAQYYNNRPASYSPWFKTKHLHTSVWGGEYLNKKDQTHFLSHRGIMYTVSDKFKLYNEVDDQTYFMPMQQFDFYHDYTHDNYLNENATNVKFVIDSIATGESAIRKLLLMGVHHDTENYSSNRT